MVAIIKTGYSLSKSFRYNETKVEKGLAECILAGHYPCDPQELTANQRLNMLLKLAEMNQNVERNSIHVTLNFHPADKLSNQQLQDIARCYMDGIGFQGQPFLVYQHHDAAHPHLHLVSVSVRADGRAIPLHNNASFQSEKTRKQIEKTYQLTAAQDSSQQLPVEVGPKAARKIAYGQNATMRAISQVLDTVLPFYKYTCLAELNAALGQYNVRALAAASAQSGRIGLRYCILNSNGHKTGVPIRASAFASRPTFAYLKKRFVINSLARRIHAQRLKTAIDYTLVRQSAGSLKGFGQLLEKEGVQLYLTPSHGALKPEIIYIDFQTKCVFAASDLGESYTAGRLVERLHLAGPQVHARNVQRLSEDEGPFSRAALESGRQAQFAGQEVDPMFIPILFEPVQAREPVALPLRKRRRRKISPQL